MSYKKLSLSLEESIFDDISTMAKVTKQSLSMTAKKLIESALEEHEDMYFSKLADDILNKTKNGEHKWITYEGAKEQGWI